MSPAETILITVSMTLAVAAFVCAWDARKYAQQATEARERTAAALAKAESLKTRDKNAIEVIHEWQRNGPANEYLTRVHRALRPPVSGNSQGGES